MEFSQFRQPQWNVKKFSLYVKKEESWFEQYYHLRSTVKRERFFAHIYFSNETVSQTTVSTGPMKMFCLEHETMNVCQTNVARFVHMESRFDKIRDISQGLHRRLSDTFTSASMPLVHIKVIYDYYSSKRVTPFFIEEEELLEYDFQPFKERLVKEVPHLAKITSLSAAPLRITMNDEKNEVELSPVYFTFQNFKENDNTLKFTKHVSTETSVIFS